ncbi:hypothetical protein DFH08DRAFT_978277 [Mycena albidolilacea]|uniref:Uncharacterized protein n=1 Tax=Mycena albidolilacea TaxID=1033008 RepID=A0AAD6YZL9_9AGAR|nr:hypothetical protein DFH08DRAFT_978277 [Mycena albidolilacea]
MAQLLAYHRPTSSPCRWDLLPRIKTMMVHQMRCAAALNSAWAWGVAMHRIDTPNALPVPSRLHPRMLRVVVSVSTRPSRSASTPAPLARVLPA